MSHCRLHTLQRCVSLAIMMTGVKTMENLSFSPVTPGKEK